MDFEITAPDGNKFIVSAPEGASQEQIMKYAQDNYQAPHKAPSSMPESSQQGGLADTVKTAASKLLSPLMGGANNFGKPMEKMSDALSAVGPSRLAASISKPAQKAGETIDDVLTAQGHPIAGKVLGTGYAVGHDPLTYAEAPDVAMISKAFSGAGKAGNGLLKTVMKVGAKVSDKAAEIGAKEGWKVPNVTPTEIEGAVKNVQSALEDAVKTAGEHLNVAKSKLGLPVTAAEKEGAIQAHGNIFGLSKAEGAKAAPFMAEPKTPEDLVKTIASFKETKNGILQPALRAKVASYLQDKINNFVNWDKSGTQVEGLLKKQYKDLGNVVQEVMPKEIRARMAKALELQDDLGRQLGLNENEGSGKAEQFLRSLFEGKSAKSKDYLKRLADLEAFTGQPVLQELFKKFAGQDLNKFVGRPATAQLAAAGLAGGLFHPASAVVGAGLLASQSPKFLKGAGRLATGASGMAETAANLGARAARGFSLSQMSDRNKQALDNTLQRLKHAK